MADDLDLVAERRAARRPRLARLPELAVRTRARPVAADLAARADDRVRRRPTRRRRRTWTTLASANAKNARKAQRRSRAARPARPGSRSPAGSKRSSEPKTKQHGAGQRQRAVAEADEQLGDPEGERGGDQQDQAGPVDRAARRGRRTRSRGRGSPNVAGKIRPGCQSSTTIPSTPSDSISAIRFGSISVSRIRCQSAILRGRDLGAAPCAGRSPSGSSCGRRSRSAARAESARRRRSRSAAARVRAEVRGHADRLRRPRRRVSAVRLGERDQRRGRVVDRPCGAGRSGCSRRRGRSASRSRCSSAAPSRGRPPPGRSRRRQSGARAPSGET